MSNQQSTAFLAAIAVVLTLFACKSSNDKAEQKSATPQLLEYLAMIVLLLMPNGGKKPLFIKFTQCQASIYHNSQM